MGHMAETFGELVRRLRETAGRSQSEQAEVMSLLRGDGLDASITRTEVSRYERGKRIPRPSIVRLYAASYGVPEGELLRAAAAERSARGIPSLTVGGDGPFAAAADGEDSAMKRRGFVGAAALSVGLAAEPWGRLAYALGHGPVDADLTENLVERTSALFAAEERMPARQLYASLAAHLDHLTALLPGAGAQRAPLLVAAGETAALAGWLCYDMGDLTTARRYYDTASQAGQAAGHPPVEALVLAYTSYAVGDPTTARSMLRAAQQHVRAPGCATARAWISAREAEESAAIGDREGALRALERAQAVYDYADAEGEQAWVRFFSRARLDSMTVAAYARLDHPDLAAVSEAALAALQPQDAKVRAVILGDVATAYVTRGEYGRGGEVARDALAVTLASEATLGRQRLAALAGQLPVGQMAARELSEELRAGLM
jgi:transcriptional regulator with XRE-family HTH domain